MSKWMLLMIFFLPFLSFPADAGSAKQASCSGVRLNSPTACRHKTGKIFEHNNKAYEMLSVQGPSQCCVRELVLL